jgi:hypothetical protein
MQEIAIPPETNTPGWIGSMKDVVKIMDDIVSPADETDWEALRD